MLSSLVVFANFSLFSTRVAPSTIANSTSLGIGISIWSTSNSINLEANWFLLYSSIVKPLVSVTSLVKPKYSSAAKYKHLRNFEPKRLRVKRVFTKVESNAKG